MEREVDMKPQQNTAQHTDNGTHEFIDMALDILRRNLAISLEQVAGFWTQLVTQGIPVPGQRPGPHGMVLANGEKIGRHCYEE
jgi:hypothetical protein